MNKAAPMANARRNARGLELASDAKVRGLPRRHGFANPRRPGAKRLGEGLERSLDIRPLDPVVGYEPNDWAAVPGRPAQYATLTQASGQLGRAGSRGAQANEEDVGLDNLTVDRHARQAAQAISQAARIVVVFDQSIDRLVQGVQTTRGDHTGLAHRAANHLARARGPLDELA